MACTGSLPRAHALWCGCCESSNRYLLEDPKTKNIFLRFKLAIKSNVIYSRIPIFLLLLIFQTSQRCERCFSHERKTFLQHDLHDDFRFCHLTRNVFRREVVFRCIKRVSGFKSPVTFEINGQTREDEDVVFSLACLPRSLARDMLAHTTILKEC